MEDRTGDYGFTLIEVIITLSIVAILAAIIAPLVINNLKSAKIAKASADVKEIANAILSFRKDLGMWPTKSAANSDVQLLLAEGIIPSPQSSSTWLGKVSLNLRFHLIEYMNFTNPSNNYLRGPSPEGYPCWNGPYLSKITKDPWDNSYLVNCLYLTNGSNSPVHVLSAGPNKNTNTNFEGGTPGSDDIAFRIQ
jgi:prepilin-type N-terminal cleavage/methylation domain-containing protein